MAEMVEKSEMVEKPETVEIIEKAAKAETDKESDASGKCACYNKENML